MYKKYLRIIILLSLAVLIAACGGQHPAGSLTTWPDPSPTPVEGSSPDTIQHTPTQPPPIQQPTIAEPTAAIPPIETASPTQTIPPTVEQPVQIAVIGDDGGGGEAERDVANLVKSWNPDFIVTLGDNNYPDGAADTIDQNIGQFYQEFISPYQGQYGPGASQPRFFPTLGNHDWNTDKAQAYFDYFVLPGNERYYSFTWGPVHIFALDSDSREPDGVSRKSIQANWLKEKLAESNSPWKLVVMHHSPYSSGLHGPVDWMRWPFQEWGATTVLAGHDHLYERLEIDGFPYFINGLGGGAIYYFLATTEGSQFRYNDDYGAQLITATGDIISFEFYNRSGELIDSYSLQK